VEQNGPPSSITRTSDPVQWSADVFRMAPFRLCRIVSLLPERHSAAIPGSAPGAPAGHSRPERRMGRPKIAAPVRATS
jgi:hypothetical protein